MATYSIDSHPEAGLLTRLTVDLPDDTTQAPRMVFEYVEGAAAQLVFAARIGTLFRIRFAKYDLALERMFWGYLEFAPNGRPQVSHDPVARKIVLVYTNVPGRVDVDDERPADVPATVPNMPPMPVIDPINVTITIRAAAAPNRGWIDFDLSHTDPNQIHMNADRFAWEETVLFPYLNFAAAAANPTRFETLIGGLNFSSVYYKVGPAVATGIAVHVEDIQGHQTTALWDGDKFHFTQVVRNSMHLLAGKFARPHGYVLSGGDPFGFGGNQLRIRLRAFRLKPVAAGAPVSWYDVAEIYRSWLRARYTGTPYYSKYRDAERLDNAPADTMAPHTVINNWGLDGAKDLATPLGRMLELHPALRAHSDGDRPSFAMLAESLRDRFKPAPLPKVEVQLWGIELAGFYQFLGGYPHLSDVLHDPETFKKGVQELAAGRAAVTTVTTDPLNLIFDRKRYSGHIQWKGGEWTDERLKDFRNWRVSIPGPFPTKVVENTKAATTKEIRAKDFDRVWFVDAVPEAATLSAAQKRNEWEALTIPPVIASGIYRAAQKQVCPTDDVRWLYINKWVVPHLFNQGVRIVEFMKHLQYFCFDRHHKHLPTEAVNTKYDNVIGYGSWYIRKLELMFRELHEKGARWDANPLCSFRLSHEFQPAQPLVQYVDQYYSGGELFAFLYSHLATPMLTPGRDGAGLHPGYREVRTSASAVPDEMLDAARDSDPVLREQKDEMKQGAIDLLYDERRPHFNVWRDRCVAYFDANFRVTAWGVAPRMYPIGPKREGDLVPWNGQDPLALTNPRTYTYNRCVRSVFNLRANIFENGAAAVAGVRLMIPSVWLEEPTDYDAPALAHAVLASRLQMQFANFFRKGRMLGDTTLPTRVLCAWKCGFRSFLDVRPLVDFIGADDLELGEEWRTTPTGPRPLKDFLSACWDEQSAETDVVFSLQVLHRVWEHIDDGGVRRILYAFANVGNTDAQVNFLYSRGLEGTSSNNRRRRTIHIIGGSVLPPLEVWAGQTEQALTMPARSFAAVVVEPITSP